MHLQTPQASCRLHGASASPALLPAGRHHNFALQRLGLTARSISQGRLNRKLSVPRAHPRPQILAAASGAAAFDVPSQQEVRQKAANRIKSPVPKPAQLPPPPKSTSLLDVLPYLTKLAVSDAQLYWRLGLAFVLMIASKAAGNPSRLFRA